MTRCRMQLTGKEARQLRDALVSAFPSQTSLEEMVRFELDLSLAILAGGATLAEIAFSLVKWSEASNQVLNLLEAAIRSNPTNAALQSITEAIRVRILPAAI